MKKLLLIFALAVFTLIGGCSLLLGGFVFARKGVRSKAATITQTDARVIASANSVLAQARASGTNLDASSVETLIADLTDHGLPQETASYLRKNIYRIYLTDKQEFTSKLLVPPAVSGSGAPE